MHDTAQELTAFALEKYYALSREELHFAAGEHGKPYLPDHPEIEFNWSHSGDYIITAVAGVPLGIDIQHMRITDIDKLGKKVFTPEEYRVFLTSGDKQENFFRQWVLKESYVKWTGEGLLRDMRTLPMDGWYKFLHIDKEYFCAIRAEAPLDIRMEEVSWKTIRK